MSSRAAGGEVFTRELSSAGARELVREAVEGWGGSWDEDSGALELPLAAGLRTGWARGTLTLEEGASTARVVLAIDECKYRLRTNAVVVLATSALGALLTVAWPLVPGLLPLAPFGAVMALMGWFLVISRLVTNRPEDLLETVGELERATAGAGASEAR